MTSMYDKSNPLGAISKEDKEKIDEARHSRGQRVIQSVDTEDDGVILAYAYVGHLAGGKKWVMTAGETGTFLSYESVLRGVACVTSIGGRIEVVDHSESIFVESDGEMPVSGGVQ